MTPCYGKHRLFESTVESDHKKAKQICDGCDFLEGCERLRRSAIQDRLVIEGTWAGEGHGIGTKKICGTKSGVRSHLERGQALCPECHAWREANQVAEVA